MEKIESQTPMFLLQHTPKKREYVYKRTSKNISNLLLSPNGILVKLGLTIQDFENKKITDIGAGLSPFSTFITGYGHPSEMNFVDPIYALQSKKGLYIKNISKANQEIEKYRTQVEKKIQDNSYDIMKYTSEQLKYDRGIKDMKYNRDLTRIWRNGIPKGLENTLSLKTSTKSIPDNSQDFVIMQYLMNNLDHTTAENLYDEAERILRPGGYIISIHPDKNDIPDIKLFLK